MGFEEKSLVELAKIISDRAGTLEKYLDEHKLPQPTLLPSGSEDDYLQKGSKEIKAVRDELRDATKQLEALATGTPLRAFDVCLVDVSRLRVSMPACELATKRTSHLDACTRCTPLTGEVCHTQTRPTRGFDLLQRAGGEKRAPRRPLEAPPRFRADQLHLHRVGTRSSLPHRCVEVPLDRNWLRWHEPHAGRMLHFLESRWRRVGQMAKLPKPTPNGIPDRIQHRQRPFHALGGISALEGRAVRPGHAIRDRDHDGVGV